MKFPKVMPLKTIHFKYKHAVKIISMWQMTSHERVQCDAAWLNARSTLTAQPVSGRSADHLAKDQNS